MINESLGHYRIIRRIGRGGMGEVYAAEDTTLNRQVAIKVLPEDMASRRELVQRFEREAKAIAALDHPNIVTIYSVERVGSLNFITMQLVEGETLTQRIPRRGVSLHELFDLAIQMTDAISAAHEHGITHRDLKPDNIMVTKEGRVMILDFGLAKLLEEGDPRRQSAMSDMPLTSEGRLIGTMAYMSPEQAEGKPVDHRSDVFSLGIILYEMASGEHPFKGDSDISVISSIVKDTPVPLTELDPRLPRHLDRIVRMALEKNREHRFQSVKDLRNELDALKREVSSSHSSATTRTTTGRRTSHGRSLLVGSAFGLAVVAGGLLWPWSNREQGTVEPGRIRRVTGEPELEVHPAISPSGKMVVYARGPAGQRCLYLRPVGGGRPIPLTDGFEGDHSWPQWSPDESVIAFQSLGQRWLVSPTGGDVRPLEGAPGQAGMAWSRDAKHLAYGRGTTLVVLRLADGHRRELVTTLFPHSPTWSPDSSRIAFVSGNPGYTYGYILGNIAPSSIWIVQAASGEAVEVVAAGALNTNPAWLDESRLLYLSDQHGSRDIYVATIDANGRLVGTPRRLTTGLDAHSFSISRDGSILAYSEFTSYANVWRIAIPDKGSVSVREARQVTRGNQVVEGIGISADGRTMVFDSNKGGNQDIYSMRLPGGTLKQLTTDPAADFLPDLSPDGEEIAFYSFRTMNRDVFVMSNVGTGRVQVTDDPAQDRYPDWAPDGNRLLFYSDRSGEEEIYVVGRKDRSSSWGKPRRLTFGGGSYGRWSPDGKHVAFTRSRAVWIVPSAGGEPTQLAGPELDLDRQPFHHWSPDGRTIYLKSSDTRGRTAFWAVPVNGGKTTRIVEFDEPSLPSPRSEFATDGRFLYFTIAEHQGDVFTLELKRR